MFKRRFFRVFSIISAFILLVFVNFGLYFISTTTEADYTLVDGLVLGLTGFIVLYLIYVCTVSQIFVYKDEQYLHTLSTSNLYYLDEIKFFKFYTMAYRGYMYSTLVAMICFSLMFGAYTAVYLVYLQTYMPLGVYLITSIGFYSILILDVVRLHSYSRRFVYGVK